MEPIEKLSRGEIENLQSERLRNTVKYVYSNLPLYRDKMDKLKLKPSDIKNIKDITKLPFVEKSDLRDNYPFGMFSAPRKDIVRVQGSSGTTGKLTIAGYTQHDIDIWEEVAARSLTLAGCTKDSIVHICYGYGIFTGGLGAHGGASKLGAMVVPSSSGNTARQISLIMDFGADILCCTPSYAAYIAEEMISMGLKPSDIPLKAGVFGAEPWTDEMRKDIEAKLGIKAFDIYGLCEIIGPGVSMECEYQNGLHVWEDHFIPEVLNAETLEPVKDGEKGELVFSTVTKTGMPLLRYRTKDICVLDHSVCKCGRTHTRMSKILGRTDDMVIIRGVNIFPSQIESVIVKLSNESAAITPNYQIIVEREHNMDLLYVKVELSENMFSDSVKKIEYLRDKIEKELHVILGLSARVQLVEPKSIPRSEGKAKRLIDNRKF